MKKIILRPKKEVAVRRFHPWVFSGAIARKDAGIQDGDIVELESSRGTYLATGHYHNGSISVSLFSFEQTDADEVFWLEKIRNAFELRKRLGFVDSETTNCYRLVHAEGDGLPGLIIDIYGETAVVQCHSIGMHLLLETITKALKTVYKEKLAAIYDKSKDSLPSDYRQKMKDGYLMGALSGNVVLENGLKFQVDWERGQKTGFFLDQRENRQLLSHFVEGKNVLNAFCYTGGFSVYALKAGAKSVDSIDLSRSAIELVDQNVTLNDLEAPHQSKTIDVMEFLKNSEKKYDVIVVDPPAFAKNVRKRHNAIQAYKRLNALALQHIERGGVLFTFSCSRVVSRQLFNDTIVAAGLEAGRQLRILHQLSQPPDHPINIFHPEGSYLKGLVVYVE